MLSFEPRLVDVRVRVGQRSVGVAVLVLDVPMVVGRVGMDVGPLTMVVLVAVRVLMGLWIGHVRSLPGGEPRIVAVDGIRGYRHKLLVRTYSG